MTPAARIERAHWDVWWIPADARLVDRPEIAWLSCDRPVQYLTSVYRTRAAAGDAPRLIDEVLRSAPHGSFRWMIADTWDSAPFRAALEELGFAEDHVGTAAVLDTSEWVASPRLPAEVVSDRQGLRDAIAVQEGGFGRDHHLTETELDAYLAGCTGPDARVRRILVRDPDGRPLSTGGLNLFPTLSFGLLWGGATLPEARGRGAYTAALDGRIRLARSLGLRWVGMYAMDHTSAPIVLGKGFSAAGRMIYLQSP